jgi:hypothetical protein
MAPMVRTAELQDGEIKTQCAPAKLEKSLRETALIELQASCPIINQLNQFFLKLQAHLMCAMATTDFQVKTAEPPDGLTKTQFALDNLERNLAETALMSQNH